MSTTVVYPTLDQLLINNTGSALQVQVVSPGLPAGKTQTATNGSTGAMADTAAHNIVAAQAAGVKFYCTSLILANTSTTNSYVTLGGLDSAVAPVFPVPANGGAALVFNPPLVGAAATAFTATPGVAATNLYAFANGYAS